MSWLADTYVVASNSDDVNTKVGCIIVDKTGNKVSEGWNSFAKNCDKTLMSQERPIKYYLFLHAEAAAVANAKRDLTGCTAYINYSPCANCILLLTQAGITDIVYDNPGIVRDRGTDVEKDAIRRLLKAIPGLRITNERTKKSYEEEI